MVICIVHPPSYVNLEGQRSRPSCKEGTPHLPYWQRHRQRITAHFKNQEKRLHGLGQTLYKFWCTFGAQACTKLSKDVRAHEKPILGKPHKIKGFRKRQEEKKSQNYIYGPEGQGFESLIACQKVPGFVRKRELFVSSWTVTFTQTLLTHTPTHTAKAQESIFCTKDPRSAKRKTQIL